MPNTKNVVYVALRPITSDNDAHPNRPVMLARLSSATKPAAAAGRFPLKKISWIIGDAWPITPMPAVTFKHNTHHTSQNCGVRIASFTSTLAVVTSLGGVSGAVHPAGCHPSRGRRTVNTPNIMKMKYRMASDTNVGATPCDVAVRK